MIERESEALQSNSTNARHRLYWPSVVIGLLTVSPLLLAAAANLLSGPVSRLDPVATAAWRDLTRALYFTVVLSAFWAASNGVMELNPSRPAALLKRGAKTAFFVGLIICVLLCIRPAVVA